jgi:hypothetical protein
MDAERIVIELVDKALIEFVRMLSAPKRHKIGSTDDANIYGTRKQPRLG